MTPSSWRTIIVLTVFVCVLIVATGVIQARVDSVSFDLECQSARNQAEQLTALDRIADRLGLPPTIDVPELPEECR